MHAFLLDYLINDARFLPGEFKLWWWIEIFREWCFGGLVFAVHGIWRLAQCHANVLEISLVLIKLPIVGFQWK